MIRERVNLGLRAPRSCSERLGRPPTKPTVEARICKLQARGIGVIKIARSLGIGTSVVQRVIARRLT